METSSVVLSAWLAGKSRTIVRDMHVQMLCTFEADACVCTCYDYCLAREVCAFGYVCRPEGLSNQELSNIAVGGHTVNYVVLCGPFLSARGLSSSKFILSKLTTSCFRL
jgi:hypothetical protein